VIDRRELLKFAAFACAPLRAAAAVSGFPTQVATRVERVFRTPGAAPNGLQSTSEGLWVLDQATNRVALVDYNDGHVLRQFDTETDRGSGITFDGQAIWIASTYNRLLVRADAQTGRTLK
jgi:DNA-binding beta-propeller fold protein YncE